MKIACRAMPSFLRFSAAPSSRSTTVIMRLTVAPFSRTARTACITEPPRVVTSSTSTTVVLAVKLPSIFLSGYIFPAEGLPVVLRFIGRLLPATHMIAILRGVILRDAAPRQLWIHIAALVVLSIVLVGASALRFRKVSR